MPKSYIYSGLILSLSRLQVQGDFHLNYWMAPDWFQFFATLAKAALCNCLMLRLYCVDETIKLTLVLPILFYNIALHKI